MRKSFLPGLALGLALLVSPAVLGQGKKISEYPNTATLNGTNLVLIADPGNVLGGGATNYNISFEQLALLTGWLKTNDLWVMTPLEITSPVSISDTGGIYPGPESLTFWGGSAGSDILISKSSTNDREIWVSAGPSFNELAFFNVYLDQSKNAWVTFYSKSAANSIYSRMEFAQTQSNSRQTQTFQKDGNAYSFDRQIQENNLAEATVTTVGANTTQRTYNQTDVSSQEQRFIDDGAGETAYWYLDVLQDTLRWWFAKNGVVVTQLNPTETSNGFDNYIFDTVTVRTNDNLVTVRNGGLPRFIVAHDGSVTNKNLAGDYLQQTIDNTGVTYNQHVLSGTSSYKFNLDGVQEVAFTANGVGAQGFYSPSVGNANRFGFYDLGGSEFPAVYYGGSLSALFGATVNFPYLTPNRFLLADASSNIDSQASDLFIQVGVGDPNTVLVGSPGAIFLRKDGGTGATLYVKETGTGNTGWVAK